MKPDWPADTGVMLRRRPDSWEGFQVLVDHRKSGSIGGFFGNGTGGFHAVPFLLDASFDSEGRPAALVVEDPATTLGPMTPDKPALLKRRGEARDFLANWRFGDWNHLRIRRSGHLALEVHDNDPVFGELRWGRGARCRWRKIAIKEL